MAKPLVSVLIPVYNVEDYLERCLQSITKQTLREIEIVCVNDGSTDNSLQILQKYQKKDPRIIIINKENGGLPSARNAGIDVARGEYVGFVDSDDYVQHDMFEKLYHTAKKHGSDVVICGANIFPEEPKAEGWLYACLSPQYSHYDKRDSKMIFDDFSTTPFLWRTFIKKTVIDTDNLRLKEDIVVGEDKAFQCKVYARANAITVIPDKLYNYFWCREGSLMNQMVYTDITKKVSEHVRLVEHIAESLQSVPKKEELFLDYLQWSIPFVYDDFIYAPLQERVTMAKKLSSAWHSCAYFRNKLKLPEYKNAMYKYIEDISQATIIKPKLSLIMPVDVEGKYLEEALESVVNQSLKEMEIIIINNGTKNENYTNIFKYMMKDKRIRVINMAHQSYADALNKGVSLAEGDYMVFQDDTDWFANLDSLENWVRYIEEKNCEIVGSPWCEKDIPESRTEILKVIKDTDINMGNYIDNDFHNIIYKTDFIKENAIVFEDNSVLTGFKFLTKVCMTVKSKYWYNKVVYVQRKIHKLDWLSTEKCKQILKVLRETMEISVKEQEPHLHAKVLSIVNGDYMGTIILNNTRPFVGSIDEFPNGENSQVEVVEHLMKIANLVDSKLLKESSIEVKHFNIKTLYQIIKARQEFLANLTAY